MNDFQSDRSTITKAGGVSGRGGSRADGSGIGCGCVSVFLTVWLTGWTAGTLAFDYTAARGIYDQYRSQRFPSVPGVITHSEVRITYDDDGPSKHAEIRYEFQVGLETQEGNTVRMINSGSANATVDRYPVGSEALVYYNPPHTETNLLEPGLAPNDFFFPLFLLPFNIIMIGGLGFAARLILQKTMGWQARHIRQVEHAHLTEFYVRRSSRIVPALITALATSFVSVFVVGIGQMVMPPVPLLIGAWSVIIGSTVLALFWQRSQLVTLDLGRGTVCIGKHEFRVSDITSVSAKKTREKHREKGRVEFSIQQQGSSSHHIVSCANFDEADWLCNRIQERLTNV